MSSARFARTAFSAAVRRAPQTTSRTLSRRPMSTSSHGSAKSDTPWIVGSVVVFGPALLYLLSPSARKSQAAHAVHHDKKEYPTLGQHKEKVQPEPVEKAKAPEPIIMTDDEGTKANVASSIELAEISNVPQDSQGPEETAKVLTNAEQEEIEPSAVSTTVDSESQGGVKEGSFQESGEEGPTDMKKAEGAALKGVVPKQASEGDH